MLVHMPSAPWKRAAIQGVAVAVLALALRAVLDGGVTGPAITFAVTFVRVDGPPVGRSDGE